MEGFFEKLTKAIDFYYGIYDYNNEINNAKQAVFALDNERNATVQKAGKKAWPGVMFIIIGGFITICVCIFAASFIDSIAGSFYFYDFRYELETVAGVFGLIGLSAFFLMIPLALAYKKWICNPITKKKRKAAKEKWYQDNNEKYTQAEECVNRLAEEKEQYIEENKYVLEAFPEAYRDQTAVIYMYKCVRDKRADTLKEAINLYEEQKHRWTIEQQNENIRDELWWMRFEQERANAETQDTLNKIRRDVSMATTYDIFIRD